MTALDPMQREQKYLIQWKPEKKPWFSGLDTFLEEIKLYFLVISRIELRVKKAGGHRSREPSFGEVGQLQIKIIKNSLFVN